MIRLSSPSLLAAVLPALALVLAVPAFADVSVVGGEKLCKEAALKHEPAPTSVRVDKNGTKATNTSFDMSLRVKLADGASGKMACAVDRVAGTAAVKIVN